MKTLEHFKDFIDELNISNSRNYKLEVLAKYKDDRDIKYYLHYLLSPYIVTGISDKKLKLTNNEVDDLFAPELPFEVTVKNCLDYVAEHNTGSYEVLDLVCVFKSISKLDEDLLDLFNKIITKNLPLGIDAKSVNKATQENVIETFDVQLANKYYEHPDLKGKEFALTTKIDGMRCIMLKENGKVTFWSRQGKQIEGLVDLENEAEKYFDDDLCLDGELVAALDNPDTYKQTMKEATTKSLEKHGLKMKVFDCMTVEHFKEQFCDIEYWERRAHLSMIFNGVKSQEHNGFKYFELLPILYQGSDVSMIEKILKEQVAKGEEGIMINICDAPYIFDRTNSLLKCKLFNDCEVQVIGFENGTNKHSNTLGALICDYKGNNLGVGSGFTDEERDYIWNHKDEYLGKYIKVKYFEETTNADSGVSLRFPIYQGIRLEMDK